MPIEAQVKLEVKFSAHHLFVHGAHMFLQIANLLPTLWADHLNPYVCTVLLITNKRIKGKRIRQTKPLPSFSAIVVENLRVIK
jgi:hypothetical protein